MEKHFFNMRNLVCLFSLLLLLFGCDGKSDAPGTPKVIRKKVIAQTEKKSQSPKVKTVQTVKSTPAQKPTAESPKPQVASTESQPQKPKAVQSEPTGQPLTAQKTEGSPPQPAVVKPDSSKKPALKPKSDISVVKGPAIDPKPEPGAGIQPAGQIQVAAATPSPAVSTKPGVPSRYIPSGRVDPFEPLIKQKPKTAAVKDKKKQKKRIPKTPLEKVDLSQLKLVAIIKAGSGNRALVEESNGKGYVIKVGTYIGINSGKVVEINLRDNKIVVAEEYEDVYGKTQIDEKELKLPKPPGEL